jgi:hypothetical protein
MGAVRLRAFEEATTIDDHMAVNEMALVSPARPAAAGQPHGDVLQLKPYHVAG